MALPAEQLGMGELTALPGNPGQSIRDVISRLLSGWGTNNAAGAASSPYVGAGLPAMSVGAGQAPTIYDNGGLPADVVQRGREKMQAQMADTPRQSSGAIRPDEPPPAMGSALTDVTPPPAVVIPARRRAAPPPQYDTAAMDYLTSPLVEGPSSRIDDDTRQRALAWALRQNAQ